LKSPIAKDFDFPYGAKKSWLDWDQRRDVIRQEYNTISLRVNWQILGLHVAMLVNIQRNVASMKSWKIVQTILVMEISLCHYFLAHVKEIARIFI